MQIEVEEFMATGIVSSYMMLVEKKSMDERSLSHFPFRRIIDN